MKFIGHLDLLKIFQSAIRRAKLPVSYSTGFNPHQRLSFAAPLPVGMDSVCEYIEIILDEQADVMVLNDHLPNRLVLLDKWMISENAPSPAAAVVAADYRLTLENRSGDHRPGDLHSEDHRPDDYHRKIDEILSKNEITVMKKTKRGEQMVDIRPDILDMEYDPIGAINIRTSAGSARNLNPTLIAREICPDMKYKITRIEIYGAEHLSIEEHLRLVPLHEAVIS